VIVLIAVALLLDLVLGQWTQATVTGLIVDLGALDEGAPLRSRLAAALGDPSLEIGYRLAERDAYVNDSGRVVELPDAGSSRAVTIVRQNGEPLAALVHDRAAQGDPELLDSVAAASRIAVANARLQAEVRSQLEEIEASRRRIVEAGDSQRRRLEHQLHEGAERRLAEVAALLDETGEGASTGFAAMLEETQAELERAQAELIEFARGIHPRVLTEGGLAAGLADLARRAAVPVDLAVSDSRFPAAVEAAAYFVCAEALANVGKYADASRAAIEVVRRDGALAVTVSDDGRGGAGMDAGFGLRGLADRVEALGGRLRVDSRLGEGTVVSAELPLD
jgi:signal transduction histidine kinase